MIVEGSDSSEDDDEEKKKGEESEKEEESSSVVPEWGSSSTEPQWGSTVSKPLTWGNNPMPDIQEEESANEWRDKGRSSNRRTRDEEIARGNSPSPKLEEDNLFTEGSSREGSSLYIGQKRTSSTSKKTGSGTQWMNSLMGDLTQL
jgi:hypothetical protein